MSTRSSPPETSATRARRRSWVSRLVSWPVIVGLMAAVLAGCSDSSAPTGDPTPRPMGPDPRPGLSPPSATQWLERVCTALLPAARSDAPAPPVDPRNPVATRDQWATFLDTRARALTTAADGINAAGPAPGEGGQQVTEPAVTLLRARAADAAASVEALRAIPANAEDTLVRSVDEIRNRFPLTGPDAALRDLALTPQLAAVAPQVPSCRAAGEPA